MVKTRQPMVGKNKVSMRVLFSEEDYEALVKLAETERTDIGSMVRRAVALQYSLPPYDKSRGSLEDPTDPPNGADPANAANMANAAS